MSECSIDNIRPRKTEGGGGTGKSGPIGWGEKEGPKGPCYSP